MAAARACVPVTSPRSWIIASPSATVRGYVTHTGMPQARSVSTCSRTFSSTLAMTRSGASARMAARSGSFSPPTRVFVRTTSAGSEQYTVTPTRASARPSSHSVSVVLGMRETMRRGGRGSASATPEASTGTSGDAAATQALHVGDELASAVGELVIPFHDLGHRLAAVDGVLEAGHRHSKELQQPARVVTGHGRRLLLLVDVDLWSVLPAGRALGL